MTGQGLEVNNLNANNLHPRYETGDFSSEGYIFDDDGPAYLGEEVDPMRKSCSLRYGFYALVKPLSNILQGFGLLDELMARKDDPVFLGRIRRGLAELFATVRKRVLQICAQKRYYIHTISLTIPAQWTLEFEDLYRDIIGEVFEHPRDHIWFNTEIEALVHYLFNYYRQELGFQAHGVDRLLITDHGGHVMVCYSPRRRLQQQPQALCATGCRADQCATEWRCYQRDRWQGVLSDWCALR